MSAAELVEREDDARAFLIADYFLIALYSVVSPIAILRFGYLRWVAYVLVLAGMVDIIENTLLLMATDSVSEDTVDAAHALEIPKVLLFLAGALPALVVNWRAFRTLRAG